MVHPHRDAATNTAERRRTTKETMTIKKILLGVYEGIGFCVAAPFALIGRLLIGNDETKPTTQEKKK